MRAAGSVFLLLLLQVFGCGGGSSTPPPPPLPPSPPVTHSLSPSTATLALRASQTFTVTASSGTPPAVNWSVNGVAGGNVTLGTVDTSGNYTAPAALPTPNTVTVTATSQSSATQSAHASVTVVFPNNNSTAQTAPVKLGTTGGNNTDLIVAGTKTTCCSGTLGSLVSRDGNFFILSNNHVLDKSGQGKAGDPIGQPGLVDNNCSAGAVVADMSQAAPLQTSNVDAALAQIVAGEVDTSGTILDLGAQGSSSIAAAPPSATLAVPSVVLAANEGVAKSGRSTGLTCSTLQSVMTNVSVDYSNTCGGATSFTVTFTNQIIINGGSFSANGDSGSLVVTSDTARPLGLLFGGNSTNTSANPIADVLNALQNPTTHTVPVVVGAADHAVSCAPTQSVPGTQAAPGAASATLSPQEFQRAAAVKEEAAASLMTDPAISAVGIGRSLDSPGEAALVVSVSGTPAQPVPPQIGGVRTQVVYGSRFAARTGQAAAGPQLPALTMEAIGRAAAIKEAHVASMMGQEGIVGVGVGRSDDAPGEAALVVYVEQGKSHPPIPAVMDGLRTKVIEGDRFRAFGWGKETPPVQRCSNPSRGRAR